MQVSISQYAGQYDTTDDAIRAEFGSRVVRSFDVLTAWSRKDADYIESILAERKDVAEAKARRASTTTSQSMATEKQISYIRSLIAKGAHIEGGYLTLRADMDLSRLTSRQASSMIDSLTGQY